VCRRATYHPHRPRRRSRLCLRHRHHPRSVIMISEGIRCTHRARRSSSKESLLHRRSFRTGSSKICDETQVWAQVAWVGQAGGERVLSMLLHFAGGAARRTSVLYSTVAQARESVGQRRDSLSAYTGHDMSAMGHVMGRGEFCVEVVSRDKRWKEVF
jgi:hypothetical protein